MKVLELLGEEFRRLRREEDVYALSSSLLCLADVIKAGTEGYTPRGRKYVNIGYLLQLELVRQDTPVPGDFSNVRYYPTPKGIELNMQIEGIGKRGNE